MTVRHDFGRFYEQTFEQLVDYARRLGLSQAEAEDIVHDVFFAWLRRGGRLDVGDPVAYAKAAVHHRVLNERRRKATEKKGLRHLGQRQEVAAGPEPGVLSALWALPVRQRRIVQWRLDGRTNAEIAAAIHRSANHVSRLYNQAIATLRASLDQHPPRCPDYRRRSR